MDLSPSNHKQGSAFDATDLFTPKVREIDYVTSVVEDKKSLFRQGLVSLKKLWYKLTAYIPRRLPLTEKEYDDFVYIVTNYYGLVLDSTVLLTVIGQMTARPASSLRFSYGSVVNAGKRMHINKALQAKKVIEIAKLQAILDKEVERLSKELEAAEPKSEPGQDNQVVS